MPDDVERQLAAFGETLRARSSESITRSTQDATGSPGEPGVPTSTPRRWWAVAGAAAIVLAAIAGFVALDRRTQDDSDITPIDTSDAMPITVEPPPATVTDPESMTSNTPETTEPTDTLPEAEPAAGRWTQECAEQIGTMRSYPADLRDLDQPFGPLAPEPSLRVVYPEPTTDLPGFSAPVSHVARVPWGTLIRLTSPSPEHQVVAVVNDDGSIRWRRCLPDSSGWLSNVDGEAGVAHLKVYPTATQAEEWWTFDLATGNHVASDRPPAGVEATEPPPAEIGFFFDPASSHLRRVGSDDAQRWERVDLADTPGEGFRVDAEWPKRSGQPALVRACLAATVDPEGEGYCDYALLGIDPDDGSTVWQLDGNYGVSLVADGYAIVTDPGGPESTYQLIDLRTGERVPDGISDAPGAFLAECCGGGDYNRVEREDSVAWTIASHWLDVWFPADHPGPGVTVDLFGGATDPSITATRHWINVDSDCGDERCTPIRSIGRGFSPGSTVTVRCWQADGVDWTQVGEEAELAVGPDGSAAVDGPCVAPMNLTGMTAYRVTFDDIASNAVDG